MESEPLLKNTENIPVKSAEKSNLRNLLFGYLVFFIHMISNEVVSTVLSQYIYRRVSEDVFGNSFKAHKSLLNQTCYVNTSDPGYILQERAQDIATEKQMQYTICKSAIAIFSTIMLGAYSDSIRRKVLFGVPLTGFFLKAVTTTIIIYWNLDMNLFFLSEGVDGLMGAYYSIFLASYAYAADNTPPTGARTMGLAVVEFFESIGIAAMSTSIGYFIQDEGFFYPMFVSCILCFIDILLVLLLLPERQERKKKGKLRCITPVGAFRKVFGFYLLEGNKLQRLCFVLAIFIFVFTCIPAMGTGNIDILFKLNLPFCWSPKMIGYYGTAIRLFTGFLGVPLFRILQCCCIDEVIGVIGSLAFAAADILQGFAFNNLMMYIVVAVRIPTASLFPVCRSILSRMAPADRQGSLFASIAMIEIICILVATPIFSNIYQHTVLIWRGLVYVVMGAVHGVAGILLVLFIFVSKSEREKRDIKTLTIQLEYVETGGNNTQGIQAAHQSARDTEELN